VPVIERTYGARNESRMTNKLLPLALQCRRRKDVLRDEELEYIGDLRILVLR
jgi:hypothetical protein